MFRYHNPTFLCLQEVGTSLVVVPFPISKRGTVPPTLGPDACDHVPDKWLATVIVVWPCIDDFDLVNPNIILVGNYSDVRFVEL